MRKVRSPRRGTFAGGTPGPSSVPAGSCLRFPSLGKEVLLAVPRTPPYCSSELWQGAPKQTSRVLGDRTLTAPRRVDQDQPDWRSTASLCQANSRCTGKAQTEAAKQSRRELDS